MDSYKEIWNHALDYIRDYAGFSPATFSIWFRELNLEGLTDSTAYISAKELYKAEFVFKMYCPQLENAIYQTLGTKASIVIFTRELHGADMQKYIAEHQLTGKLPDKAFSRETKDEAYSSESPLSEDEKQNIEAPKGTVITSEIPPVKKTDGYIEEYTFENFIVGKTNKFAHAACLAIANNPAQSYNPLFIYSPSGLGKTHLLYAISNETIRKNKAKKVLYVKGSDFTEQLVDSLVEKKPMHYFREKYRTIDVLLVDDIQFIAGKESTQEEFFHTFNALYEQHKQIIITSDRPPKDLKNLAARLRTRFESGLMVDIQPPELELRIAIVKSKADSLGIAIPDRVIMYIAENIKSSVRQLEGVVKRLHGYSFIYAQEIDLELAKKCINDLVPKESVDDTVEKTFDRVCEKYQVSVKDITGKRRQANIVVARHVATYILRQITDLSSIEIARYFSQDHSSILSAIKNVEKKIDDDPSFEDSVTTLIREIKE